MNKISPVVVAMSVATAIAAPWPALAFADEVGGTPPVLAAEEGLSPSAGLAADGEQGLGGEGAGGEDIAPCGPADMPGDGDGGAVPTELPVAPEGDVLPVGEAPADAAVPVDTVVPVDGAPADGIFEPADSAEAHEADQGDDLVEAGDGAGVEGDADAALAGNDVAGAGEPDAADVPLSDATAVPAVSNDPVPAASNDLVLAAPAPAAGETGDAVALADEAEAEAVPLDDEPKTGWQTAGGSTYYYDQNGVKVTGELQIDGAWYYFDPVQNGLRAENSFVQLTGAYLANGPKTVFYDKDGRMRYGEQEVDGAWYYLAPESGARAESAFVYLDGAYLAGGPKTVYYGDDGKMAYGEQAVDGSWYYLDPESGARAESEFVYLSGDYLANGPKTVYYGDDGKMAYGEQAVDGSWYYLDPEDGARAHDTYVLLSGSYLVGGSKMVYYGSDGKMFYGEHVIDGYRRWFDPVTGATDKIGWQNPIGRFQVSANNVRLPGYAYGTGFDFVTPSRIGIDATREDCVEAFVARAYEYLGTPYVWDYALAPGVGVDCAGLVMQCLYAAGMNLGDYNPYLHITDPWHDHDANNMAADPGFAHVSLDERQRGDLLFYPGHVAIYIGNDQVINAYPPRVQQQSMWTWGTPTAVARPFV